MLCLGTVFAKWGEVGVEREAGDWPLLCILGTGVRKWRK